MSVTLSSRGALQALKAVDTELRRTSPARCAKVFARQQRSHRAKPHKTFTDEQWRKIVKLSKVGVDKRRSLFIICLVVEWRVRRGVKMSWVVTFAGGRRRESAEEQRNHIADCLKYHRERCLQIKNLTNITRSDNNLRYHMASCPLPLSSFSRASGKKGKQHQQQQARRRIHKILRSEKNLKTHFETTPMCCCCCYCCLSSIHSSHTAVIPISPSCRSISKGINTCQP